MDEVKTTILTDDELFVACGGRTAHRLELKKIKLANEIAISLIIYDKNLKYRTIKCSFYYTVLFNKFAFQILI